MEFQTLFSLPISPEDQSFLTSIYEQYKKKTITLGVFGSFSVGKSALINRLVGKEDLLPTHTNETTAIPTFIRGGDELKITANHFDGSEQLLNVIKLHSLVAGSDVDKISNIDIQLDSPSWLKSITFIDTPGRNTKFQSHIDASEQALVNSDAVLYIMPWQGLTIEDIVYIKHILRYQPNLSFIINKVDRIDENQGISIEQMCKNVKQDLQEQLGQSFPVFAVSAKTSYNIDLLYTDFILPMMQNIENIKEERFNYAVRQFLESQQKSIVQQIELIQLALNGDNPDFTMQKQQFQIAQEKLEIEVQERLNALKNELKRNEVEMKRYIVEQYEKLGYQLSQIAKQKTSVEQITLQIEDAILTTRNVVFSTLHGKIQGVVGDHVSIALKQPKIQDVSIQLTEKSFEQLEYEFMLKQEKLANRLVQVEQQLLNLPEGTNDEERTRLSKEIETITEQTFEQFVPQYIIDENYDANKAEKILSAIGFVGDMALTVGLAVVTAGGSAAAQVGGKVAAKEITKATAKQAAKQVAKKAAYEAGEKVLIEAAKSLASSSSTSQNGDVNKKNKLLVAAEALDKFTSPVQTIAKKIGQSIDVNNQPLKREDMAHRQTFFANKMQLEMLRDEKLDQLRKIEMQVENNERIRQELMVKKEQIMSNTEKELEQLKCKHKEQMELEQQQHMMEQISSQLEYYLQDEESNMALWFQAEFVKIYQVMENMLPTYFSEELQGWNVRISEIEQLQKDDMIGLQQQLQMYKEAYDVTEQYLVAGAHA